MAHTSPRAADRNRPVALVSVAQRPATSIRLDHNLLIETSSKSCRHHLLEIGRTAFVRRLVSVSTMIPRAASSQNKAK